MVTVATPRIGTATVMPDDRPISPTNWWSRILCDFLPANDTSAPPPTRRKTEAESSFSAWRVAPLRKVVHVPADSSFEKSTALTPWWEKTAFHRSNA